MSQVNTKIVGICGVCGGEVVVPTVFHSTVPPKPQCSKCHRYAATTGPIIKMEEFPPRVVPSPGVNGKGYVV